MTTVAIAKMIITVALFKCYVKVIRSFARK